MTASMVPLIQTWSEVMADIEVNWLIYLSMPIVAAFVGYSTKLLALWMLYYPLEHRGIGPLGWQGIIPRRAGKLASITIQSLMDKLLDPRELLDNVDAEEVVENLREPLMLTVDSMARELVDDFRPGLWDSLPEAGRRAVLARVHGAAPKVVDHLVDELKDDLSLYVDLHYIAVTTLVRNKLQLNGLIQGMAGKAQQFVRRSGIYFGILIGLVQMVAWGFFQNPWIMPAFGFITGFVSDWLALNLLFIPRERKLLLGFIPFQGIIHGVRDEVTVNYARIMATDIFAPEAMIDAILNGPTSDRLFALIEREVSAAIDEETRVASTVMSLAVGSERYRARKNAVVAQLVRRLPFHLEQVQLPESGDGAVEFDVEAMLVEKMSALTNAEFESVMRPIFKDDEMLMVMVGAILGFAVGELQVLMVEHLAR